MRDAWEECATIVCALWSLCAVPVVIVDTVAMPGFGWEKTACRRGAYVPVEDVKAVDCHRRLGVGVVLSDEPLAFPAGSGLHRFARQMTALNLKLVQASARGSTQDLDQLLFYYHLGQSLFVAFSDVSHGTIHLGIPIHDSM